MWRGIAGTLAALGLMTGSAQAFQVGIDSQPCKCSVVQARFVAAPWDRTDLTVRASDGGQTITFHDANGVVGKNPPPAEPWPMQPCQTIDQHTARCHSTGRLEVWVTLSDSGSRFRDLAPAAGTPNPYEYIFSGVGDDDIAVRYGWYPFMEDGGGMNTLASTGGHGWIMAFNGVHNTLDLRNGQGGDTAQCRTGLARPGPNALENNVYGGGGDQVFADHGVSDTVLSDAGDTVDGCENDLPA